MNNFVSVVKKNIVIDLYILICWYGGPLEGIAVVVLNSVESAFRYPATISSGRN